MGMFGELVSHRVVRKRQAAADTNTEVETFPCGCSSLIARLGNGGGVVTMRG